MIEFTCGKCLFAEEIGSSDLVLCTVEGKLKKINEPACGKFPEGSYSKSQNRKEGCDEHSK